MDPIELKPNLSHCIETLSKREYERTLNLLLKKGPVDEKLGKRLEALRLFLESTNFGYLRSQYQGYLTEGKKVIFFIYLEGGKARYKFVVEG